LDEGNQEDCGFAGAGLRSAGQVPTFQGNRQGQLLDGAAFDELQIIEDGLQDSFVQRKILEIRGFCLPFVRHRNLPVADLFLAGQTSGNSWSSQSIDGREGATAGFAFSGAEGTTEGPLEKPESTGFFFFFLFRFFFVFAEGTGSEDFSAPGLLTNKVLILPLMRDKRSDNKIISPKKIVVNLLNRTISYYKRYTKKNNGRNTDNCSTGSVRWDHRQAVCSRPPNCCTCGTHSRTDCQ
jgi:hypothetical protein